MVIYKLSNIFLRNFNSIPLTIYYIDVADKSGLGKDVFHYTMHMKCTWQWYFKNYKALNWNTISEM